MGREEHEEYLSSLDKKLFIDRRKFIRANFDCGYTVSMVACATVEDIKLHARAMLYSILGHDGLYYQYLVERFVRLSAEFHKINYDFEPFCRSLGVTIIATDAVPQHDGLFEEPLQEASLRFESEKPSGWASSLSIERRMEGYTPRIVVTKPFAGYSKEVFRISASGAFVVVAPDFISIEIESHGRWHPSREISPSMVDFVERNTRNGSIFLLRPNSYGGDPGPVVSALETLFAGFRFSCISRARKVPNAKR